MFFYGNWTFNGIKVGNDRKVLCDGKKMLFVMDFSDEVNSYVKTIKNTLRGTPIILIVFRGSHQ